MSGNQEHHGLHHLLWLCSCRAACRLSRDPEDDTFSFATDAEREALMNFCFFDEFIKDIDSCDVILSYGNNIQDLSAFVKRCANFETRIAEGLLPLKFTKQECKQKVNE